MQQELCAQQPAIIIFVDPWKLVTTNDKNFDNDGLENLDIHFSLGGDTPSEYHLPEPRTECLWGHKFKTDEENKT